MNLKKVAASAAAATVGVIATVATVSACGAGTPQLDDLKGAHPVYPNYNVIIVSPDGYPNVDMTCYQGAGFALTTRDAAGAITREPEWDAFCKTQEGKQATQNGQP
jgi:hypothetical protein